MTNLRRFDFVPDSDGLADMVESEAGQYVRCEDLAFAPPTMAQRWWLARQLAPDFERVCALLAEGRITRAKAAEALSELVTGATRPALPDEVDL